MGKYSAFLKESDLFYNLTATQLELIDSICEERNYRKGDVIFQENSRESELYLILKGKVDILFDPNLVASEQKATSTPQVIATLRQGQSFGEMALIDEGLRSASANAVDKETILLRLPRHKLLLLCNSYPELGYRVMYNLSIDLAHKIRNAGLQIREALLYGAKK